MAKTPRVVMAKAARRDAEEATPSVAAGGLFAPSAWSPAADGVEPPLGDAARSPPPFDGPVADAAATDPSVAGTPAQPLASMHAAARASH